MSLEGGAGSAEGSMDVGALSAGTAGGGSTGPGLAAAAALRGGMLRMSERVV